MDGRPNGRRRSADNGVDPQGSRGLESRPDTRRPLRSYQRRAGAVALNRLPRCLPVNIYRIARRIKKFVGTATSFIEVLAGPAVPLQIPLTNDILVMPLGPLGNARNVNWGTLFVNTLGIVTDLDFQAQAVAQGAPFNDLTAVIYRGLVGEELTAAIQGRSSTVQRHRTLLGLLVAGELKPFLRLTWDEPTAGAVEFLPPPYPRGLTSRHEADPVSAAFISFCATERADDDRLHYFLNVLSQAHGIEDTHFRIARYYSLLEALAGPIISQFEKKAATPRARTAIRFMLGYFSEFDIPRFTILPAEDFEFDHIELAGRIRHKLFHGGGALNHKDITPVLEPGLALLGQRPDMIAHWLRRDCELEIVRWAHRESLAWLAANGENYECPRRSSKYDGGGLNKPLVSSSGVPGSAIGSIFVRVEGADLGVIRLALSL